MAPERVSNKPYDGRADVYSLGITLFEMLAGQRPFPAQDDPMSMLMMHVQSEPSTLREVAPELSPELEQVVARALHKEPAERLAAYQLKVALERAVETAEARKRRASDGRPEPPPTELALPTVVIEGSDEGLLKRWVRKIRPGE